MTRKSLILILAVAAVASAGGRKVKVPAARKSTPASVTSTSAARDSVVTVDSLTKSPVTLKDVSFSGFDKTVDSANESMFITNNSRLTLVNVETTIEYLTTDGRELHSRDISISCDIPPGATRQVSFRTWDRQKSFYYELSRAPIRRAATPFKVKLHSVRLRFVHNGTEAGAKALPTAVNTSG